MAFIPHHSPFHKHLHSLVINGFFTRDLDADDHAFLEQVRTRGIANGELPRSEWVSIEELEFWHMPYPVQPGIARKHGPIDRTAETDERRQAREIRAAYWRARAAVRDQDKKIAAAELERERREYREAQRQRLQHQAVSDYEWEAADPKNRRFGTVVERHYVPQWKIDEDIKLQHEEREAREAQAAEHLQQQRLREREALAFAQQQAEARRADFLKKMAQHRLDPNNLSRALLEVMRQNRRVPWTIKMLARATGCDNAEAIRTCLINLKERGYLQGTIE